MVSSSLYKDGQFLLLLDNPVTGGSYTCTVPPSSASFACLHAGPNDHSGEAAVSVATVEARLTVVEAQQAATVAQYRELIEQLASSEQHVHALAIRVDTVTQENSNLSQQVTQLDQQVTQLNQANQDMHGKTYCKQVIMLYLVLANLVFVPLWDPDFCAMFVSK